MSDLSRPCARLSESTTPVTGGTGFIGSSVADSLVPDTEVRILDDGSTGSASNVPDGAKLIQADVTNRDVVDRSSRTLVGAHSP